MPRIAKPKTKVEQKPGRLEPQPKTATTAPATYSPTALRRSANLLKQAADPTRLHVLLTLSRGEKNVTELCDMVSQSQPAVSHHLALLRHGRLIEPDRRGKSNYYRTTDEGRALADAVRGLVEKDGIPCPD